MIYTSINSGLNWTERSPVSGMTTGGMSWNGISSSSDGKILAVFTYDNTPPSLIYTSDDSGANWKPRTIVDNGNNQILITFIGISPDGKLLVAAGNLYAQTSIVGRVYISNNLGLTWTDRTPAKIADATAIKDFSVGAGFGIRAALSTDGSRIAILATGEGKPSSYLFTSSNSGANWFEQTLPATPADATKASLYSVASSANGSMLIIARAETIPNIPNGPSRYSIYTLQFP